MTLTLALLLGLVHNLNSTYIVSFKSIENKTSLHSNKNMCICHINTVLSLHLVRNVIIIY